MKYASDMLKYGGGVTIINYIININDDGLKLHFCNDADLFVIKVCLLSMRLRSNIFFIY